MNDLELLGEQLESGAKVGKRKPVRPMLELVPAGSDPKLGPPTGDVVDGRDGPGEDRWVAKGHRRDEGSEANPTGASRKTGERRPGVERASIEDCPKTEL